MNTDDSVVTKISNKNYASDIKFALHHTRWYFTILGVWSHIIPNPKNYERYLSIFFFFLSSFFMLIIVVPLIMHVILYDIEYAMIIKLIGPMSFDITSLLKYLLLFVRSDSIKKCIQHMESDWQRIDSDNDREIMMKSLKIGHDITIVCAIFVYSGASFYHAIMPLWRGKSLNEFNETVRSLVYPGTDRFLDPRIGFNYEIIFCTICISSFFLYAVVTASCNLAAIFVTHACGQIQIVMSRLKNLLSTDNDEKIKRTVVADRIAFIIRRHVRVLKFSSEIDEVLREICLLEVVAATIIICLLEYYCMTEWNNSDSIAIITYFLLLVSFSFNVFIYCYIGELLKDQCHQVRTAAYNLEWYRLPGKTGLSLVMIIMMANYPRKLTAGKMIELSIHTFGTIIRTSLGYLNMLRTVA